jgi:peptide/nickel transport system permease protein
MAADRTELALEVPAAFPEGDGEERATGVGPGRLALRRLRRNKPALAFGGVFLVVVALCLAAPVWSKHVAHIGPNGGDNLNTVTVGGKKKDVVSPDGVALGPTWHSRYFLGAADQNGNDLAVRLLYGGRNSLQIGIAAALVTTIFSLILGILAGFLRGFADGAISRVMDVIWAFPVILLGIALGTAFALGGINLGIVTIPEDSKWVPILIIAIVYIPYMGRPIRGQVLGLREREFVEAARAQGMRPLRIMFSEILPNLSSTVIVFFPLMVANAILLEAALGFVGVGVRPPDPSWGTLIGNGVDKIPASLHLTIVPGLMLVIAVLSLNVFGDGVRDAFDPRSTIKEAQQ